jgi:hypothetical protein
MLVVSSITWSLEAHLKRFPVLKVHVYYLSNGYLSTSSMTAGTYYAAKLDFVYVGIFNV